MDKKYLEPEISVNAILETDVIMASTEDPDEKDNGMGFGDFPTP